MKAFNQLKRELLHWHKKIGLLLFVWIIWVAASGIVINHAHSLGLDKHFIKSPVLLSWFYSLQVSPTFVAKSERDIVFSENLVEDIQSKQSFECTTAIAGVIQLPIGLAVICQQEAIILDNDFAKLITLTVQDGIVFPVSKLADCLPNLCYQTEESWYQFDLNEFINRSTDNLTPINFAPAKQALVPNLISYERFILDLHSGSLFSNLGKWFVDLFGALLIVLSSIGVYLHVAQKRNKANRQR